MRLRPLVLLLPVLLLVLLVGLGAAPSPQAVPDFGQLITLRAYDSTTAAWDDRTGEYVTSIDQGEFDLSRATLAFGILSEGQLSYGFRNNERSSLVDVGDFRVKPLVRPRDIVPKPAVGVINTLRVQRNNVQYMAPIGRWLNLVEGDPIFGILGGEGVEHVTPQLGHVYLLRYALGGSQRIVAFHVVEHVPGMTLTLRVKVLSAG